MNVQQAIKERRAYRALEPVRVDEALVRDLAGAAQLAPSCFNNQPWRYVFVFGEPALTALKGALNEGNAWARSASMIIAVCSKKEYDCVVKEREYYLFDTGMATAFLILRATELGLVAHPIAGYDEVKVREALGIPADIRVITIVNVGRHAKAPTPAMSEKQRVTEEERPERLPFEKFASIDHYTP